MSDFTFSPKKKKSPNIWLEAKFRQQNFCLFNVDIILNTVCDISIYSWEKSQNSKAIHLQPKVYHEVPMDFSSLSTKPKVTFEFQTNEKRITPLKISVGNESKHKAKFISHCFIMLEWPVFLDLHSLLQFGFWFCLASKVANVLLHENIQYPAKCATWGEFYPLFLHLHLSLLHHHHLKTDQNTHTDIKEKLIYHIQRPDLTYNLTIFKMPVFINVASVSRMELKISTS